jgi:glucose-1-phosphate thymidylyltransferase
MITKGIILAGGKGSRLSPLTKILNKQLLPLYDKPIIFYSLSILMLAGIRNILIITNPEEDKQFKQLLGDGKNLGINIEYAIQKKPGGLPEAFIIGENFINKKNVALILGDNFFYGQGLRKILIEKTKMKSGSCIFCYQVQNPENYGVVEIKNKKILNVTEKPKKPRSDIAITGLYFFDKNVIKFSKQLKPSKRNELEITDIIKKYLKNKKLAFQNIGRGSAWLDTGTIDGLYQATQFVEKIEKRQGLKIACLEEIALYNKWISKHQIMKQIKFYGDCDYSKYLKKLINLR